MGIHILLEEIGAPYETEKLDISGGATHEPAFLAVDPKGKVPALVRDDGSVLTEFSAIATWLARMHPEAKLIPGDAEGEARTIETMAYVEGTIHGQGFGRLFMPARFEPQDAVHQGLGLDASSVKKQGRTMIEQGFEILDAQLAGSDFAVEDAIGISDMALFCVERWAPQQGIALPSNLQRHYVRMIARPAVAKVCAIWDEV